MEANLSIVVIFPYLIEDSPSRTVQGCFFAVKNPLICEMAQKLTQWLESAWSTAWSFPAYMAGMAVKALKDGWKAGNL